MLKVWGGGAHLRQSSNRSHSLEVMRLRGWDKSYNTHGIFLDLQFLERRATIILVWVLLRVAEDGLVVRYEVLYELVCAL